MASRGTWWQTGQGGSLNLTLKQVWCSWLLPWQEARLQGCSRCQASQPTAPQASTAEPQIITSLYLPSPRALWGPRGCSASLPSQPSGGGCAWASCPCPPGCCHCSAKPAVLHYLGANLAASRFPVPACAGLPLTVSRWLSEHSQLSGDSSFTFRPGGG